MIPNWFLYIGGGSLIILGGLQIQARPRRPHERGFMRWINLGTAWSACCIAVGAYLVLMALGYVDAPGQQPAPAYRRAGVSRP